MSKILEKLKAYLNSPEGQETLKREAKRLKKIEEIDNRWIEKFHMFPLQDRISIVERIKDHYASKSYRDRWYNRGIEPPESLLFLYWDYANKYGEKVPEDSDLNECLSQFTVAARIVDGFFVEYLCGQGSLISITKIGEDTEILKEFNKKTQEFLDSLPQDL